MSGRLAKLDDSLPLHDSILSPLTHLKSLKLRKTLYKFSPTEARDPRSRKYTPLTRVLTSTLHDHSSTSVSDTPSPAVSYSFFDLVTSVSTSPSTRCSSPPPVNAHTTPPYHTNTSDSTQLLPYRVYHSSPRHLKMSSTHSVSISTSVVPLVSSLFLRAWSAPCHTPASSTPLSHTFVRLLALLHSHSTTPFQILHLHYCQYVPCPVHHLTSCHVISSLT
ncbi:hypothetical protein CesoFtcFv8_020386 [Champsocephalus esox]|uniref:Uncharacterized protein n=1 Tax=Champsocephalus esox TaxID=159716 RepID=A0AAN8GN33_9TELE|nr:hypothetical protein CesoFtcFv8_020386 [Champsocephalus esox]